MSTCRQLALRGHKVSGFEQFTVGSYRASSFGESRIIRYTYPDALYTGLMARSYALWRDIQARADVELLVQTGILIIGPEHLADMRQMVTSLQACGVNYQILTAEECRAVAPAIHLRHDEVAIFQQDGGFLRATSCVRAVTKQAVDGGALLLENMLVRHIEESSSCVTLVFEDGSNESFDNLVVAAGPWVGKLLQGLMPLTVTRQEVAYFKIGTDGADFMPARLPVWIDLRSLVYGFPLDGVIDGVKVASHISGATVDPDSIVREPDYLYQQTVALEAQRRLPALTDRVVKSQVCMYTNTPDEDFILDWFPGSHRIFIVSGCSGHGFKFTPLLGEIAAASVCEEDLKIDISRFSLSRFSN